jgi:hypothetical protein
MFLLDKKSGEAPEQAPGKTEEVSLDKKETQSVVSGVIEIIYAKITSFPSVKMTKEELDALPFSVSYTEIPSLPALKAQAEDSEKYTKGGELFSGGSNVKNSTIQTFGAFESGLQSGKYYLAEVEGKSYVVEKQ